MNGRLAFLPLLWGSAATQIITEQTGIALGLVAAAILMAIVGAWRAGREKQRICDRLKRLEDDVIELKAKRK